MKGDHERNREYVRHAEEDYAGTDRSKVKGELHSEWERPILKIDLRTYAE